MNPFKGRESRKEKKEKKKEKKLEELMEVNNLENLSHEDKESIKHIFDQQLNLSMTRLGFSSEDVAKTGLLDLIVDQNIMIIKLLNDISNKLDK